jgi:hypothetical protein
VMPRHVRIEYPGAFYHVMARGDRGESIALYVVAGTGAAKLFGNGSWIWPLDASVGLSIARLLPD